VTATYVRSPWVLWRTTATAVLARHVDGRGTTLSGTGVALWDHLDQPRTLDELVALMQGAFDAPVDDLTRDLREALRRLRDDGVVLEQGEH
jgi:hypothetical protein